MNQPSHTNHLQLIELYPKDVTSPEDEELYGFNSKVSNSKFQNSSLLEENGIKELQSKAPLNSNSNAMLYYDYNVFLDTNLQLHSSINESQKVFALSDVNAIFEQTKDPERSVIIINKIIQNLKSMNMILETECAEYLMSKYYPFIEGYKYFGTEYHLTCLQLVLNVLNNFSFHEYKYQSYSFRLTLYFLMKLRSQSPDNFIVFREFAFLYSHILPYMIEDLFRKVTLEFALTFCPSSPLFDLAVNLVKNCHIHNFDELEFTKLLLKLDNPLSQGIFNLLEYSLASNCANSHIELVKFLLYIACTKPIWSRTAIDLLMKCHLEIDDDSRKFVKIFIRRAFQWTAISSKKKDHATRRIIVMELMQKLRNFISFHNIVDKYASTLLMSESKDFYLEIKYVFPEISGSFDQAFLDELSILELCPDYNSLIIKPKKHLTLEQSRNLILRNEKDLTSNESDIRFFDPYDEGSFGSLFHNNSPGFSVPLFYITISILIILVFVSLTN
ncbi:hypothetical protein TVAG_199090 [Trichomonas vaginalis G3]|uniref:Uncharacterized protein n=1 Tax=Trichomonas vaginalis (strain ATCC PRA-98 / G3) TaxID=412133 RepID=A2DDU4_TRIV3|nr:hypothetical protein TVAGG3_0999600 [Trichomonas vaginalis G3]EAY21470.1 hypothetical protein TVAG_199090 [Trichomonas vaginalis G3]KAI5490683.1 hypothetical protein TVAGG3_0999600 [Trichomonas vaginalis G3]|eukprot:XP_001582456.1 hypothetical protein [Trichomonas vaginalis G3]